MVRNKEINVSFILVKHNNNVSYCEIKDTKNEIGGYVDIEFNTDVSSIMIDFTTDTITDTSACSILIKKDSEFDNLIDISKVYFHGAFNSGDTVATGINYQKWKWITHTKIIYSNTLTIIVIILIV